MGFQRWGTQSAQPVFNIDGLLYAVAKGKGGRSLLVTPTTHHPWEVRGIDHPDAIAIAAAPTDVAVLVAEVRRLRAVVGALVAHDPYPVEVFSELTEAEQGEINAAMRGTSVRHPLDRTYASWGRRVLAALRDQSGL